MFSTNRNRSLPARSQKGFTLLEIIIVLAIIAGGAIVVLGISSGGRATANVEQESSNYNALIENARVLKSGGTFGAASTNLVPALINRELIPRTMAVEGTEVRNRFGGQVTVVSNGFNFTVTAADIPQAICSGVATNLSQGGAYTTQINGSAAITGVVSAAQADSGCSESTNTLSWTAN